MRPEHLEFRNCECLKYCETQENCQFACGLEPVVAMEDTSQSQLHYIIKQNVFQLQKEEKELVNV